MLSNLLLLLVVVVSSNNHTINSIRCMLNLFLYVLAYGDVDGNGINFGAYVVSSKFFGVLFIFVTSGSRLSWIGCDLRM